MKLVNYLIVVLVVVCLCFFSGCQLRAVNVVLPESYSHAVITQSSSPEVLSDMQNLNHLISQSQSVIASVGQNKKDRRLGFTMVAFDEDKLKAKRKYFFITRESKGLWLPRKPLLQFETEMEFEPEFMNEPYPNERAQKIAILRKVLDNFRGDIHQVRPDNKDLSMAGMMASRVLKQILQKLNDSPVLATKLSEYEGMDFDEENMGKGKIRLIVAGQMVKVEIKIGPITKEFNPNKGVIGI